MEQDKKLQKILLNSSEKASVKFTEAVMERVQGLSAMPQYQPLVNRKIQKAFVAVFAVLVASVLLLSMIIAAPDIPVPKLTAIRHFISFVLDHYDQIIIFILSFWVVFIVNALFQKRSVLN